MSSSVFSASTVLFEFNNVLAKTYDVRFAVYKEFLAQFDIEATEEEFEQRVVGPTDKEIVNFVKANYDLEQELTDLDEFYFLLSKKAFDENVTLNDGAVECLKHFRSLNFRMGLVTFSSKVMINDFLEKHDLKKYFEVIVMGDKVAAGKPQPEIYINALSRFDSADDSVFIIEGSKNGITSGYKAGIFKIVGVGPKSKHLDLMKAGAMVAVESLKELQNLPWTYE